MFVKKKKKGLDAGESSSLSPELLQMVMLCQQCMFDIRAGAVPRYPRARARILLGGRGSSNVRSRDRGRRRRRWRWRLRRRWRWRWRKDMERKATLPEGWEEYRTGTETFERDREMVDLLWAMELQQVVLIIAACLSSLKHLNVCFPRIDPLQKNSEGHAESASSSHQVICPPLPPPPPLPSP
eukprot:763478-Hanusia_phi.AAC.4